MDDFIPFSPTIRVYYKHSFKFNNISTVRMQDYAYVIKYILFPGVQIYSLPRTWVITDCSWQPTFAYSMYPCCHSYAWSVMKFSDCTVTLGGANRNKMSDSNNPFAYVDSTVSE